MSKSNRAVCRAAGCEHQDTAIAELEGFGLSLRIINLLEDKIGLIWLDELLAFTPVELQAKVPNLGAKSVRQIVDSVHRFRQPDSPATTHVSLPHLAKLAVSDRKEPQTG